MSSFRRIPISSTRSTPERIDGCDGYWRAADPEDVLEAKLDQLAQWFRDMGAEELAQSVASYTARFKNGSAPAFLARLLGSKRYLRLERAAEKDWALVLLGVRRLLRLGLPLGQALEDAFVTLTEEERTDFGRTTPRESAYLELLLQVDAMIDAFLGRRQMDFSELGFPARDSLRGTSRTLNGFAQWSPNEGEFVPVGGRAG